MSYSAHNTPRKKQRTSSDDDTNPLFEFIKERKKQDPKRTDEYGSVIDDTPYHRWPFTFFHK